MKSGAPVANDRKQNARVRSLLLNEIERLFTAPKLSKADKQKKDALLLRMAPNLLPRLNAGRDDDEQLIPQPLLAGQSNVSTDHSTHQAPETDEAD